MQKMMLMAAVAVLGAGAAGAQSWSTDTYKYTLLGCARLDAQTVTCSGTITYTDGDSTTQTFYTDNFKAIDAGGREYQPIWMTVADGKRIESTSFFGANLYRDLPVKFTAAFKYTGTVIPRLVFDSKLLSNLPVKGMTVAPAPVAAPVGISAYTAVMTNCKAGANGTLTCTATLTPRR